MKSKSKSSGRLLLLLIVLLLASLSYFALEFSDYYQGSWKIVEGYRPVGSNDASQEKVEIPLPVKEKYNSGYWQVLRRGKLFIKEKPAPEPSNPIEHETTPKETKPPAQPTRPECPWQVQGVMLGKEPTAIVANKKTRRSKPIKVGELLEEYRVVEINRNYVILEDSDGEQLKLELGGK